MLFNAFQQFGVGFAQGDAGAGLPPTNVDAMELGDWRRIVDINLNAMFHVSRDAFRMMAAQEPQGGRIVNNGSVSAASMISAKTAKSKAASVKSAATAKSAASTAKSAAAAPAAAAPLPKLVEEAGSERSYAGE